MIYQGIPYEPAKRYFGPQGHWLCKYIPAYPPGIKELEEDFNKAAFKHGVDYSGKPSSKWWQRIFHWFLKSNPDQDYRQRKMADQRRCHGGGCFQSL